MDQEQGCQVRVRLVESALLQPGEAEQIEAVCTRAFAGDFNAADMDHAMGGVHALAHDTDGTLVGHGAVVPRQMVCGGRTLNVGYVEAVAVVPERQRQGVGRAVMDALDLVVTTRFDAGALSASDEGRGLYRAVGWREWEGTCGVKGADGSVVATPGEEDEVMVRDPRGLLAPPGLLVCDWRPGDVW